MNIITNKEVFSEENQANTPKKVERRRGRPRKTTSPAAPINQSVPTPQPAPSAALPEPGTPVQPSLAPHTDSNARQTNKKTVFYQASRPHGNGDNQTAPRPNKFNNRRPSARPLNPRPDAPRATTGRTSQSPAPQGGGATFRPFNQQNAGNGGRFQTARRRPNRHQFPQDSAGVFINRQPTAPEPAATIARNPGGEKLKIIPLGGLEEIGKNMTVFEYGNDILIVDMGFMFPDSEMLGVDYIIPDVTYLEDKKDRIRGAIITHGHLDHTGAIPYLVQKLGFPTLYGTAITMGMAKGRLEEFGLVGRNKLVSIEPEKDVLQLGAFTVRPFRLMHSIPGAIGLEIETPNGRIAYCTDWKFDYTPASGEQIDFRTLAAIGSRGVDLLFSDSTNVDRPGHSISERVVESSILTAVTDAPGRVIIAMFASDLNRVQMALNAAAKNGRKVLLLGRSMQQNVEMAIGLKALNIPEHTIISEREANRFADEKLLIISTGAQGEERAALSRMASGEHRVIKIKKGDTVILSASPIPGNERSVSGVMDKLYKAGASVIYNKIMDTHTSGHAYQEDLKLMLALMRPQYFVPLHGERARLILHGKLAEEVGVKPENVVIGDNGLILEMDGSGRVAPTESHVPAGYVMVDGLGVGDVGNIVLRDRQAMAQEGVFFIVSVFDSKGKRFLNSPDIISRGFIYMRENEKFVNDVRNEIKQFLQKAVSGNKNPDVNAIRNDLRDMVSKHLYEKTERQPMVIPVIVEV